MHEHGLDVPVTIGPLALRIFLLYAVPAVAGFAVLWAFRTELGRTTVKWVTILATIAVLLVFMLAEGIDIPSQATILVIAALAVPVHLAMSTDRRAARVAGPARRIAPWVLSLACGGALAEFTRGWLGSSGPVTGPLHTGLVLALIGISWLTICLPRSRVFRTVVRVESAVLALAMVAAAGHATVLRPPDPSAPQAVGSVVQAMVSDGR